LKNLAESLYIMEDKVDLLQMCFEETGLNREEYVEYDDLSNYVEVHELLNHVSLYDGYHTNGHCTNTGGDEYVASNNQLIDDEEPIIILEPVVSSKPKLQRKRSYKPVEESVRPGKKAKRSDSELTEKELKSRNKRRANNRAAAQRARDRRFAITASLEEKNERLENENKQWEERYMELEEKYKKIEFRLNMIQKRKTTYPQQSSSRQPCRIQQAINHIDGNLPGRGSGYKPARLIQLEEKKLKLSIFPTKSELKSVKQASTSEDLNESFCNLNEFIKVDTPTAKQAEKMAMARQDTLFNFIL